MNREKPVLRGKPDPDLACTACFPCDRDNLFTRSASQIGPCACIAYRRRKKKEEKKPSKIDLIHHFFSLNCCSDSATSTRNTHAVVRRTCCLESGTLAMSYDIILSLIANSRRSAIQVRTLSIPLPGFSMCVCVCVCVCVWYRS